MAGRIEPHHAESMVGRPVRGPVSGVHCSPGGRMFGHGIAHVYVAWGDGDRFASFAGTLETVTAGRTATVLEIRQLADRLEALPLDAVAEVLVLLEPTLDDLRRQAALALERAPAGRL